MAHADAQLPCLIANGVSQSRIARTVECAATELKRDWKPKGRRKPKAARLFEMSIDRSFLAVKSNLAVRGEKGLLAQKMLRVLQKVAQPQHTCWLRLVAWVRFAKTFSGFLRPARPALSVSALPAFEDARLVRHRLVDELDDRALKVL